MMVLVADVAVIFLLHNCNMKTQKIHSIDLNCIIYTVSKGKKLLRYKINKTHIVDSDVSDTNWLSSKPSNHN